MSGADDVPDQLLTRLYGEDPTDFISRRAALVKELRAQGQPDLARRVASLRRPGVSVWAVNRLRHAAPDQLQALTEAGAQLREAQIAALSGEAVSDLRSLLSAHSAAVQRASDAAAGFLVDQGQRVSEVVRQRLQTTLRAASLGPPELRAALADGRLVADQEPGGFGAFEGVEPGVTPEARPARMAPAPSRPDPQLVARAREARAAADTQARRARDAMEEARRLRERADRLARGAEEASSEAVAAEERAQLAAGRAEELERAAKEAEGDSPRA